MNDKVKEKEEEKKKENLSTKDRWLVYIMIALRMSPVKIEPEITGDGRRVLMFYFAPTKEANDIFDRKLRGEEIMVEAGALEQAERVFKNNVQRYNNYR